MMESNPERNEERAIVNGDDGEAMMNIVMEIVGVPMPGPQDEFVLKGLDTRTPTLQLKDGTVLTGAFEETVGTQMIFKDPAHKNINSDDAGPSKSSAGMVEGSRGPTSLVNMGDNAAEPGIELEAFTDVKLVFRKNN
eukprot:jgi/Picsp_1/3475/NSC_06313-R1_unnamed protein product [Vitis vinifera]